MRRQKHSDFYYKLNELTHKLHVFTDNFKPRVPNYELAFKKRQLEKQKQEYLTYKKAQVKKTKKKSTN